MPIWIAKSYASVSNFIKTSGVFTTSLPDGHVIYGSPSSSLSSSSSSSVSSNYAPSADTQHDAVDWDVSGLSEYIPEDEVPTESVPIVAGETSAEVLLDDSVLGSIAILPTAFKETSFVRIHFGAAGESVITRDAYNISVDFGDGSPSAMWAVQCLTESSNIVAEEREGVEIVDVDCHKGEVTVSHVYQMIGSFHVVVNVSSPSSSSSTTWSQSAVAEVQEPIDGITLELVSPSSLVALFEEVVVMAMVTSGSNLNFIWDFGDESDGQYTKVENFGNRSVASHSYGIADTYTVSLRVFNSLYDEPMVAHLETPVRAVEPIKELLLRPISGRYAVPLVGFIEGGTERPHHENVSRIGGEIIVDRPVAKRTAAVVFEARVWRGSDVEFVFDFGDGSKEHIVAVLDVWAAPTGLVGHNYTEVGAYNVSVTATNPLGSITRFLDQLFYVQIPPQNLSLDKPYYITPKEKSVTLEATILQGTNVSFDWIINDEVHLTDGGPKVVLNFAQPAVYVISVIAYNLVTNRTYGSFAHLWASAKVYVQDHLQGVELCVHATDSTLVCEGEREVDLPLDEDVVFQAAVVPETETALRFTWDLGIGDLKKTNMPIFHQRYRDPGIYKANITVQNHISSTSSGTVVVNMIQKIGNLTGIRHPSSLLVGKNATFHALFWFGSNLTFEWDFGDGTRPVETKSAIVQHTFQTIGEYWIKVMAWNLFSHASVSTNVFVLEEPCQKPEIKFVDERKVKQAYFGDPVFIEVDVTASCSLTSSVLYLWSVQQISEKSVVVEVPELYLRHQNLYVPPWILPVGDYSVNIRATMNGTIVTSSSHTHLIVIAAPPILTLEGGVTRRVGRRDNITITGLLSKDASSGDSEIHFHWSCLGLGYWYYPCLQEGSPFTFSTANALELSFSGRWINPNLQAIQMNLTVSTTKHNAVTAAQVLEFVDKSVLMVSVNCINCKDHGVNSNEKLIFKASCLNCSESNLIYEWRVWQVLDGYHDHHLGNHDCVNADGSTFFIFAPNSTETTPFVKVSPEHTHYLNNSGIMDEELPPFPNLLGLPEEHDSFTRSKRQILEGHQLPASPRNPLFSDPSLSFQEPIEGEPVYDNFFHLDDGFAVDTTSSFSPTSQTHPPYGNRLPSDFHVTEEGSPGEGGSASARDQSRFGILLNEHSEETILEGKSKGREDGGSGQTNHPDALGNPNSAIDPVKDDRFPVLTVTPHLVEHPRLLVDLSANDVMTLNSEYLVIKPGTLRVGSTYLIEAVAKDMISGMEGSAMEHATIILGPTNGRCTLVPLSGIEFRTHFRLHCLEWKSKDPPLYYQLHYALQPNNSHHVVYEGLNRNVKFILPAGHKSNNYSVYLNVEVRSSKGATTKVCSIVRQVLPLGLSRNEKMTFVHNITFHANSSLSKSIAEKNVQSIFHITHALATYMNNGIDISRDLVSEKLQKETKVPPQQNVREKLVDVILETSKYRKIHAVQSLSAISAVIQIPETVTPRMMSKTVTLIRSLIAQFINTVVDKNIWKGFMHVLAHLLYISTNQATYFERDLMTMKAVAAECHKILGYLLKEQLFSSLAPEEDLIDMNLPHMSLLGKFFPISPQLSLTFGQSFVRMDMPMNILNSSFQCFGKHSHQYLPIFALYYPYNPYYLISTDEILENMWKEVGSTVSLKIYGCNTHEEVSVNLNQGIDINIPRQVLHILDENINQFVLLKNQVNIHRLNVTEQHWNHSLLISFETFPGDDKYNLFPSLFFRYRQIPTLREYDYIYTVEDASLPLEIFLPAIQETGIYFIAVSPLSPESSRYRNNLQSALKYYLNVRWDECMILDRESMQWTSEGCSAAKGTNSSYTTCRCNAISSYSVRSYDTSTELSVIPIEEFCIVSTHFLPICFLCTLIVLFGTLFWVCYNADVADVQTPPIIVLPNNNPLHAQAYLVSFYTGYERNSGTTAKVCLVLHGEQGMSEIREMICCSDSLSIFKRGSKRSFVMSTENSLGKLWKIQVWHNNAGSSPSWFLQGVNIIDLVTGDQYYFDCKKWFAVEDDHGLIEREIVVGDVQWEFWKYFQKTLTEFSHSLRLWPSLVSSSSCSCFCRCHTLSCCFLAVLVTCTLSAVWFHATPRDIFKNTRLLDLTWEPALVGTASSTVGLIVAYALCSIFRNSRLVFTVTHPTMHAIFSKWSLPTFHCWWSYKASDGSMAESETASSSSYNNTYGSSSDYDSEAHSFEDSDIIEANDEYDLSLCGDAIEYSSTDQDSTSTKVQSGPISLLEAMLPHWHEIESWAQRKHQKLHSLDLPSVCPGSCPSQSSSILGNRFSREGSLISQFSLDFKVEMPTNVKDALSSAVKSAARLSRDETSFEKSTKIHSSCLEESTGTEDVVNSNLSSSHQDSINISKSLPIRMRFQLPSCFRVFGWLLLFVLSGSCAYLIGMLTLRFSQAQLLSWAQSLVIGYLITYLFIYYLVAIVFALLFTLIETASRKTLQLDESFCCCSKESLTHIMNFAIDSKANPKKSMEEDNSAMRRAWIRQRARILHSLRPPPENVLNQERQRILKEKRILKGIKSITLRTIFLMLLIILVWGRNPSATFLQNESVKNAFIRNPSFSLGNIKNREDWMKWMHTVFLPFFYEEDEDPHEHNKQRSFGPLMSTGSIALGCPMLWIFTAPHHHTLFHYFVPSALPCNTDSARSQNMSYIDIELSTFMRNYEDAGHTENCHYEHGFRINIPTTRNLAHNIIKELEQNINLMAVKTFILEFNIFNPSNSLFIATRIEADFSDLRVTTAYHISSVTIYQGGSSRNQFILISEFAFLVLLLCIVQTEISCMMKGGKIYWKNVWHCIKVLFCFIGFLYFVTLTFHFHIIQDAVQILQEPHDQEEFIDLHVVSFWEHLIQKELGCLIFLQLFLCLEVFDFYANANHIMTYVQKFGAAILSFGGIIFISTIGLTFCGNLFLDKGNLPGSRHFPIVLRLLSITAHAPSIENYAGFTWKDVHVVFATVISLFIFAMFSALVKVVITNKKHTESTETITFSLKEVFNYWKMKLKCIFFKKTTECHDNPKISIPTEFLLFELESVMDDLLNRVNKLTQEYE